MMVHEEKMVSAMFDYTTGKRRGKAAELSASLEHALGHLGTAVDEGEAARAAFLTHLQRENNCAATGKPCREWSKCGCWLEMEKKIEEARAAIAAKQDA